MFSGFRPGFTSVELPVRLLGRVALALVRPLLFRGSGSGWGFRPGGSSEPYSAGIQTQFRFVGAADLNLGAWDWEFRCLRMFGLRPGSRFGWGRLAPSFGLGMGIRSGGGPRCCGA